MDLERWVIELLESIKSAGDIDAGFDLHLDSDAVKAIASAYEISKWVEIY